MLLPNTKSLSTPWRHQTAVGVGETMVILKVGSSGDQVEQVQRFLADPARQLYSGAIDGVFGNGTRTAVIAFQAAAGLIADGIVGPLTWKLMFPSATTGATATTTTATTTATTMATAGTPAAGQSLAWRCLSLTGSIETGLPVPGCFGGLSGNFDGQGISYGAIQWALGQGTLAPLFQKLCTQNADVVSAVFGANAAVFTQTFTQASHADQMTWATGIQTNNQVQEPWKTQFKTLGTKAECQGLQIAMAQDRYNSALSLCRTYGLVSERAVALMFDIMVQNGGISGTVQAQIEGDFAALGATADETPKLEIVARRRAAACNPKWENDVLSRKMMIAQGQGTVHGAKYDLAAQYGITLNRAEGL